MKKKFCFDRDWKFSGLIKLLKVMRLTVFLLLVSVAGVLANKSYSQTKMLNLNMHEATVKEVLKSIEDQSEFYFLYSENLIDVERKVNITIENKKVEQVLNLIFEGTGVEYSIRDHFIVLTTPEESTGELDVLQQPKTISGKVTDSSGLPLPGVSVIIKGTTQGAVTNADGEYSLVNVPENTILQFSFVGMKTQEVPVGSQTTINISMVEEAIGLEEVVAIGYGTMKKSDLTGAVSSVKSEELNSFPTNNLSQALQGRSTGIHVQQNSGAPGSAIQIRIRGTNSIQGSNEPLWIIDGFPGDQSLLNSSDIESIEILKDASATAIYGSRGANGVILVTTKRGREGKTKIDYQGGFSIQTIRKKMDLMNAKEYAQFYNIFWENTKGAEYFSQNEIDNFGESTDWQDIVFRAAPVHNHSLTVSGGNNKTQFSVGTSYLDQGGIIETNDYRRIVLRSNVNHEISDKFNISFNTILSRIDNNPVNDSRILLAALSAAPTVDPYDEDGDYTDLNTIYAFSPDNLYNPEADFNEVSNLQVTNRVMANVSLLYKPIDGLSIKISGNVSNTDYRSDSYTGVDYPTSSGGASISSNRSLHLNSDNIVTYNKNINEVHNISVTGALTYEKSTSKSLGASGSGFLSDATETYNIGSASTIGTPWSSYSDWALLSYLGRLNYSYKNKYLATVSFRADGSSRYSEGNKWGFFPSGAIAWRITEENFMKNLGTISDAKIRVGYGETGSTAISPYYTLDMLSSGKALFENGLYTYFAPGTRLPGDLKWETTSQIDFGLDISFIDNRFRITSDYYIKNTRDLLNTVQLPASLGYRTTVKNIGEMRNRGFEFQLDANILNREFKWDMSANISFNRNEIVKLYEGQDIPGSIFNVIVANNNINLLREGESISAFYGYKWKGFDENGHYTYQDITGDGEVTDEDRTFIGDPNPDFIYGLNSNMSWKNFDLNLFIQGSYGNDIFALGMVNQNYKWYIGYNMQKEVLYNHWSPENVNARYPVIDEIFSTEMADNFMYNGSYIRLKNIELSYNLPLKKYGINWLTKGQVYISAQNLLTITDYPWWDPEVNSYGGGNSINQGIDYYSYPTAKSFTVGVKLSF
ncbi:TonB-dependent receptor [Maribellus maritimus]|uniref:TonB-dependent receptor n=1 Tax=Maribellus maritimus TaxID=2870838 RepID=UPI001EE9B831|nr:TonB-dependent receptor [Maribellus maritimus]MCG6189704.1 TonB-dependent receptor [Maribellus maritimus]